MRVLYGSIKKGQALCVPGERKHSMCNCGLAKARALLLETQRTDHWWSRGVM